MSRMKRYFIVMALSLMGSYAMAQSGAVQKVGKAVFSLTTFKSNGELNATSYGVFTSKDGEALALYSPFIGADSAIVVDAQGKIHQIEGLMGANEIYDVCHFKVEGSTNAANLSMQTLAVGEKVWQVGYAMKKPEIVPLTVKKVEEFMDQYGYYLFNEVVDDHRVGCPVVNGRGEVVALGQQASKTRDGQGTDARYIRSFTIEQGLSVGESVYQKTGMKLVLPSNPKEALNMLVLSAAGNQNRNYGKYLDDFIRLFPSLPDGYTLKAQQLVGQQRFAEADAMMQEAIAQVDAKDVAHGDYARIIYNKVIYSPDTLFTEWTLDKALEEAKEAYRAKPEPAYLHQQAQIIFSQQKYDEALTLFTSLADTPLRSSEIFYEAAQCKANLQRPNAEIIELLDSAVASCPRPLTNLSAPYVLARGRAYDADGQYRKAIVDYYQYDSLMMGRASDDFYYIRYQCELNMRQYQQALNDIAHAAYINPQPGYFVEMASLQLRVNQPENALKSCELAEKVAPDMAETYLVKGLALIQLKQKKEGLEDLEKAKSLGAEKAQELIEKYK